MESFGELIAQRYSVRDFADTPVEKEKLDIILEAARLAPTAVNYQPVRLYVVQSREGLEKLSGLRQLFGATVAVIVCYDDSVSWKNRHDGGHDSGEADASIVTTHMMLQAWELGIGSCWIGAFCPVDVCAAFDIPACQHPVAILAMGYAGETGLPSDRHGKRNPVESFTRFL